MTTMMSSLTCVLGIFTLLTIIQKGLCVSSSIQPSPTVTVAPVSTSSIAPPTPPPTSKPSPAKIKRIYDMNLTLTKYIWKPIYSQQGPGDVFLEITQELPNKLRAVFGELKDFNTISFTTKHLPSLVSNDQNKLRVHLQANFTAATNSSQEPEIFLDSKNAKGDLGKFELYRIVFKETVMGGTLLGAWVGGCAQCCGNDLYQNRTCSPAKDCGDFILNRKFPCHWKCPVSCGTVRTFTFNVSLTGYKWKSDYTDTGSAAYKELYDTLTKGNDSFLFEVKKMFSKVLSTAYKSTSDKIMLMKRGEQVGVSFSVVFGKPPQKADDPEAIFLYETENGKLGKFNIDVKSIDVSEKVLGYTFTDWKTSEDSCRKCCGGEATQTRTCTATVGKCTNAQLERKIRCKHVCENVECSGAKESVPYRLAILIPLVSSLVWLMA